MALERFGGGWVTRLGTGPLPSGDTKRSSAFVDAIVGFDVLGGFWLLCGQKVLYFAPDSLDLEDHDLSLSGWVDWLNSRERIESFYETFLWPGWSEDIAAMPVDHVMSFYPPLFTAEGRDLNRVLRRPIPVIEAWEFALSTKTQLDGPEATVTLLAKQLLSWITVGPINEDDTPQVLRQSLDRLINACLRNNCEWWPNELDADGMTVLGCTRRDETALQLVGTFWLQTAGGSNLGKVPVRLTLQFDSLQPYFEHVVVEIGDVAADQRPPEYPKDSIVFFADSEDHTFVPVIAIADRVEIIRWTIASSL